MKKYWIIIFSVVLVGVISCSRVRRNPGRAYMPDMAYSRAYETYASTEALQKRGIHYTAMPVAGTIARGDLLQIYTVPNDSMGYAVTSRGVKNPLRADSIDMKESERLYLVNCGICHGPKLDGNGPLYNSGKGPYPNAPRNLTDDYTKALADGTIFHVITYGKGVMGSYASQLNPVQRWMVVDYIRAKQGGGAKMDSTGKSVAMDTTAKKPATDTTKRTR